MQDHASTDWISLLAAARSGDDCALEEVWKQLREYLFLTADDIGGHLKPKLDASDIVQQSLLEVHEDLDRFRGQNEAEIRAWLIRLVQRNLIDASRRYLNTQQRDVTREHSLDDIAESQRPQAAGATASSMVRRKEVDEQLLLAVAQLPQRSQQILQLRHQQGLSHAEAGRELGMTEAAARKLWSRTVQDLRKLLASEHVE